MRSSAIRSRWPAAATAARTCKPSAAPTTRPGSSPTWFPRTQPRTKRFSRLTMQPAVLHGLWDRGMLRPCVRRYQRVRPRCARVEPIRFVRDFPTGASRLIFGARCYHQMIVNGELLMDDGKHTGALPGRTRASTARRRPSRTSTHRGRGCPRAYRESRLPIRRVGMCA